MLFRQKIDWKNCNNTGNSSSILAYSPRLSGSPSAVWRHRRGTTMSVTSIAIHGCKVTRLYLKRTIQFTPSRDGWSNIWIMVCQPVANLLFRLTLGVSEVSLSGWSSVSFCSGSHWSQPQWCKSRLSSLCSLGHLELDRWIWQSPKSGRVSGSLTRGQNTLDRLTRCARCALALSKESPENPAAPGRFGSLAFWLRLASTMCQLASQLEGSPSEELGK